MLGTIGQQANSQGQTIVVASGDSGAAGCDAQGKQPDYPAQDGASVSVPAGFAELHGGGRHNAQRRREQPRPVLDRDAGTVVRRCNIFRRRCGTRPAQERAAASGGGVSVFFPQPSWQQTPADIPGRAGALCRMCHLRRRRARWLYVLLAGQQLDAHGTMCADGFWSSGSRTEIGVLRCGRHVGFDTIVCWDADAADAEVWDLGNVNPTLYNMALMHTRRSSTT